MRSQSEGALALDMPPLAPLALEHDSSRGPKAGESFWLPPAPVMPYRTVCCPGISLIQAQLLLQRAVRPVLRPVRHWRSTSSKLEGLSTSTSSQSLNCFCFFFDFCNGYWTQLVERSSLGLPRRRLHLEYEI
ncbi:hypothetical protein TgHK011_006568 [Trichoderma gracile]|nr:hypothetical protein TgHK011_006568 [Trichoderma gracile]